MTLNKKIVVGIIVTVFGVVLSAGSLQFLPDIKPIVTSVAVAVLGAGGTAYFLFKSKKEVAVKKEVEKVGIDWFGYLPYVLSSMLVLIALLVLSRVDWSRPADPFAIVVLAILTATTIAYAKISKHKSIRQINVAGAIFVIGIPMILVFESGALDFIGQFYRLFVPFYQSFDPLAETVEYSLIALTLILSSYMIWKKVKVSDHGSKTLLYFLLQPLMAIFLFEMLGLPAGFLAGATTRSDLLVTNTNAAMSTFGMVFIAVVAYISFLIFGFPAAMLFSGAWWVFWKPFLLHHPDPSIMLSSAQSFFRAGSFLFLTAIKRMTLPMILVTLPLEFTKGKKSK